MSFKAGIDRNENSFSACALTTASITAQFWIWLKERFTRYSDKAAMNSRRQRAPDVSNAPLELREIASTYRKTAEMQIIRRNR